jgi:hypothetical protein
VTVSPDVEQNVVSYPPSVLQEPSDHLRFMHRRRINKVDRNGDPLDGVVNLFDVAIVLAVAFLLAALTGIGLSDVLTGKDLTIVKNPGQADMQVIVKKGSSVETLNLQPGQQASGLGTLIGQLYRLADGTTIYVPTTTSSTAPTGTTLPTSPPSVAPSSVPTTSLVPSPTLTPAAGAQGTSATGQALPAPTLTPAASLLPSVEPRKKGAGGTP